MSGLTSLSASSNVEVIEFLQVDFTFFLKSDHSLNHHHKVKVRLNRQSLLFPQYGNCETVTISMTISCLTQIK